LTVSGRVVGAGTNGGTARADDSDARVGGTREPDPWSGLSRSSGPACAGSAVSVSLTRSDADDVRSVLESWRPRARPPDPHVRPARLPDRRREPPAPPRRWDAVRPLLGGAGHLYGVPRRRAALDRGRARPWAPHVHRARARRRRPHVAAGGQDVSAGRVCTRKTGYLAAIARKDSTGSRQSTGMCGRPPGTVSK